MVSWSVPLSSSKTNCSPDLTTKSWSSVFRHVFETVETSSVPIYRFALDCLLIVQRRYSDDKDEPDVVVMAIIKHMADTDRKDWTALLSVLDRNVLIEVCIVSFNVFHSSI